MKQSMRSATAWLLPLLMLSGCSILLEPADQCSDEKPCGSTLQVCDDGLCVLRQDDGGMESTDPYVLTYFTSDQTLASDSLHLAYSSDGLNWEELNDGRPAYTLSGMGSNHIRDPFILKKEDGTFVYMATDWTLAEPGPDYWNRPSSSIFLADSTDLITFTNPRLLEVTPLEGPNGSEMHAWAPEAFFDPERQEYAIIWSGNDSTGMNRIYVSYTTDFNSLVNPTPEVYYDPGYPAIDGTVVRGNGRNYLFFKDESDNNGGALTGSGKDIQIARTMTSSLAAGSFVRWDIDYVTRGFMQSTRQATEGPMVIKVPNQNVWFMCADYFVQSGVFGCWRNTDLDADPNTWSQLPNSQFRFPSGAKHAAVVRVTQAQLDALIAHYGVAREYQIRTNALADGMPGYMAHSWNHAMVTHLSDRTDGQLEGDFAWRIVPGLADPSDPDLVSFESVILPGQYLRINSANVADYFPCNQPSNRSAEGCAGAGSAPGVPEGERNYLGWVHTLEDTPTFRSDATFRRVPALNGNGTMVSFQWYGDSTRYLREMSLQIFAKPATDNTAASFTLEVR